MGKEVQLVSDGDGLAVVGAPSAIEGYLKSAGLWASSQELDMRPLTKLLSAGSDLAQAASEYSATSGRWVKLTEESARLVAEHGLMPSKLPGQAHLMIGAPGSIGSWLQAEQGFGPLLTNPAALSGLGGVMAQAAMRQTIAELRDYLVAIDQKVDDVLRKADDSVVAQIFGTRHAVERALRIRDETGEVNETLWSTVAQAHQVIGATQDYAVRQLDAIALTLEATKVKDLARAAEEAEDEVPKWLGALALCFELQEGVDVLELDRVLVESPEALAAYRRGLTAAQRQRRDLVAAHTQNLLDRMDRAVGTANAKLVRNRAKSLDVVESANRLATEVHDLQEMLAIEDSRRSWDVRRLKRAAELGSQAIQAAKDKGPIAASLGAAGLAAVFVSDKLDDDQEHA